MESHQVPQSQEATGKTVEEAIDLAVMALGVGREEVEVEVLSEGKQGFLGIRSEPARVKATIIPPAHRAAQFAMEVVTSILRGTGVAVRATLRSAHDPQVGGPVIDIQGEDSGLLIGRRGETMRALQFLVNLIVNKKTDDSIRVMVDVESYRARREKAISDMALKVADRVASSGRTIALEPMSPAERRVVHLTLANNARVRTESVGSGTSRKVTIIPKRG